jgi:pimeloyl-ACP methyl ester carboxylesterase
MRVEVEPGVRLFVDIDGAGLVTPIADAWEIVPALPPQWRRFQRFENAGHGAWRDQPKAALAAIRAFVLSA